MATEREPVRDARKQVAADLRGGLREGADVGTSVLGRLLARLGRATREIVRTAWRTDLRGGRLGTSLDVDWLQKRVPEAFARHFDVSGQAGSDSVRVDVVDQARSLRISAEVLDLGSLRLGPLSAGRVCFEGLVVGIHPEGRLTGLLRRVAQRRKAAETELAIDVRIPRLVLEDVVVEHGQRLRRLVLHRLCLDATGLSGAVEERLDDPDAPVAAALEIGEVALFDLDGESWSLSRAVVRELAVGLSQSDATIRLLLDALDGVDLVHPDLCCGGLGLQGVCVEATSEAGVLPLLASWPIPDVEVRSTLAELEARDLAGAGVSAGSVSASSARATVSPEGALDLRADRLDVERGRWADAVSTAACQAMQLEAPRASLSEVGIARLRAQGVQVAQKVEALLDEDQDADAEVLRELARAVDDGALDARIRLTPLPDAPFPLTWMPDIAVQARATAEGGELTTGSTRLRLDAPRLRLLFLELLGLRMDHDGEVVLSVQNGPDVPLASLLDTLGAGDQARVPLPLPEFIAWATREPSEGPAALRGEFDLRVGLKPRVLQIADQEIALAEPADVRAQGTLEDEVETAWDQLALGPSRVHLAAARARVQRAELGEGEVIVGDGTRVRMGTVDLIEVRVELTEPLVWPTI